MEMNIRLQFCVLRKTVPMSATPAPPAVLATGLAFPEGPVLSRDGSTLYCVNVQAGFLSRLDLATRTLTREWLTLPDGGRGNGATLGPDHALYVADVGARRIVRIGLENDPMPGAVTIVADTNHVGAPLRGPNDLIFAPDGSLYFTDPEGSSDNPIGVVYKVRPATGQVSLVADGLRYPNGLVLSQDAQTLYVAQSPLGSIDAIHLASGVLRPFAHVSETGGPDGLRLGPDSHIYAALFGDGVVAKVSPQGEVVARLPVGGRNPTNLCFAPDGRALYITEAETHSIILLPLPKFG